MRQRVWWPTGNRLNVQIADAAAIFWIGDATTIRRPAQWAAVAIVCRRNIKTLSECSPFEGENREYGVILVGGYANHPLAVGGNPWPRTVLVRKLNRLTACNRHFPESRSIQRPVQDPVAIRRALRLPCCLTRAECLRATAIQVAPQNCVLTIMYAGIN